MPDTIAFSMDVPTGKAVDVIEKFTDHFGYQENIPDGAGGTIPNPQTRNSFAKQTVREWVKDIYIQGRGRVADGFERSTADGDTPFTDTP